MVVINLSFDVKTSRMAVTSVSTGGDGNTAVATRGDDNTTVLKLTYLNDDDGVMSSYLARCEFDVYVRYGHRTYKPFVAFDENLTATVDGYILSAAVNNRLPIQLAFKEDDISDTAKEFYSVNRAILVISDSVNANLTPPRDPVKFMEAINRVEYDKNTSTFTFVSLDGSSKDVVLSDLSEDHFEVATRADLTTLTLAEPGDTATTLDDGKWYKLYGDPTDLRNWYLMSSFRYGEFLEVDPGDRLKLNLLDTDRRVLSSVSSAITLNGTDVPSVTPDGSGNIAIYTPTVPGQTGQILRSRGTNLEPEWIIVTDDLDSGTYADAQEVLSARQGNVLRTMVELETETRAAEDAAIRKDLTDESKVREDTDAELRLIINQEIADRKEGDSILQTDVDSRIGRAEVTAVTEDVTITQDANSVTLNIDRYDPTGKAAADVARILPVASEFQAGVMTVSHVSQLNTATADINTLKGRAVMYVVELTTDSPTQEQLNEAYAALTPPAPTPVLDGTTLVDQTYNKEYTYYTSTGAWLDRGQSTVNIATQSAPGIVMGSTADGKVYVEGDGSMSLMGWDALNERVANNTSAIATEVAAREEAIDEVYAYIDQGGSYQPGMAMIRHLGDGTSTDYRVEHDLGTSNLVWSLRDHLGRYVDADVSVVDSNTLNVSFTTAPPVDGVTMTIVSGGMMMGQFVHEQTTPAEVWECTHNMNRYPQAVVLNSEHTEIYAQITHIDENNIRVTFNTPTTGVLILE